MKSNLREKNAPFEKAKVRIQFNVSETENDDESKKNESPQHSMGALDDVTEINRVDRRLKDLSDLKVRQPNKITAVCLNKNQLHNINGLSTFKNLMRIEAQENLLFDVRLRLEHLLELNLSKNQLNEVKDFSSKNSSLMKK